MAEPAECSLLDFLDGPAVQPSSRWVDAVTRRGLPTDKRNDRAERALAMQHQAEEAEQRIADLRARRSAPSRDDEAVGVLMAAFNVDADRAFECLLWVSQQSGTPLPVVTQEFLARVESLAADGHGREELLGLLSRLAGRTDSRAS